MKFWYNNKSSDEPIIIDIVFIIENDSKDEKNKVEGDRLFNSRIIIKIKIWSSN